ncbi:MAG: hypothetical protein HY537_13255 [Deltaproteobacteria bacterium]|nr:hypothetical protein [Deltaproteobacteria bacterium]
MKAIICKIDQALKGLYSIDLVYQAQDFLVENIPTKPTLVIGNKWMGNGALLIEEEEHPEHALSVGIYLNQTIQAELSSFDQWPKKCWSLLQISAFAIAAEEVSHFNYLLFNALAGRSVSQLELEFQAEVDKFLLTYFANIGWSQWDKKTFTHLFEQFFIKFSISTEISPGQKERYVQASQLAKGLVLRFEKYLSNRFLYEKAFRLLRRFYRLSVADKISFVNSLQE